MDRKWIRGLHVLNSIRTNPVPVFLAFAAVCLPILLAGLSCTHYVLLATVCGIFWAMFWAVPRTRGIVTESLNFDHVQAHHEKGPLQLVEPIGDATSHTSINDPQSDKEASKSCSCLNGPLKLEDGALLARKSCNWVKGIHGASHTALAFVEDHLISDIEEEGLLSAAEGNVSHNCCVYVKHMGLQAGNPHQLGGPDHHASSNESMEQKGASALHSAERDELPLMCSNTNSGDYTCAALADGSHGRDLTDKTRDGRASPSLSCEEDEAIDVPELEDCCTSSSDEEIIYKLTVLENAGTPHVQEEDQEDAEQSSSILDQPAPSKSGTLADNGLEEEKSVDKHQILPPVRSPNGSDVCNQHELGLVSICDKSSAASNAEVGLGKIELTDAELQKASGEFYTLEGDVLWNESDLKKLTGGRKNCSCSLKPCDLCMLQENYQFSSEDYSIYPCRTHSGIETIVSLPPITKAIKKLDAIKGGEKDVQYGSTGSAKVCKSVGGDVLIDQELRAIAFRSGNKGDESNYLSTAGSFREFAGSFRETEAACWAYYGLPNDKLRDGEVDDTTISGCCDDQSRPCIAHSRSRSKVLQSDPLLSKDSLTKEQEIMDVLWQEYNEDWRAKSKAVLHALRHEKGLMDSTTATTTATTVSNLVLGDGSTDPANHHHAGNIESHNERLEEDGLKACWHVHTKSRGYNSPRRKHFLGLCKMLREMGLKQCIQSSKVNN